jgi:hypothetical protein
MSLGIVAHGRAARGQFSLCNSTDAAVTIGSIELSCPCVRAVDRPVPFRVAARERVPLNIEFDPDAEPDFHGKLAVKLEGFDTARRLVLSARVDVTVE